MNNINKNKIVEMVSLGHSIWIIAEQFKCSPRTVFEKLKKYDIKYPKGFFSRPEHKKREYKTIINKEELSQFLSQNNTIWQISKKMNCSVLTVKNTMKRFGFSTPKGFYSRGLKLGRKIGSKCTEEQKSKMRERCLGKGNPFYDKKHTEQTRKKMSKNHADFSGFKNPFSRSLTNPEKYKQHVDRCKNWWNKKDTEYKRQRARKHWKGCGEISGTFWRRIETNAMIRNIELSVDIKYVWNLFEKQKRKCAITGTPLKFGTNLSDTTASLDRIDNNKGYVPENLQWVHKRINIMKGKLSMDEFNSWCKLASNLRN
jgi:DNA-binding CsgD family transcriptional regulator